MVNKITVVGAGNVGATAAQRIAEKELARHVIMVDVAEGVPQGKGLDQYQSAPIEGFDSLVIGSNGYEESAGSDIVVITAGIPRKPGMSRDDLVNTNAGIMKSVCEQVKRTSPDAIVIVVSNPLDVMCYVAKEVTGFPRERVIGMAGVLDTARYCAFLAMAMDVSVRDIRAMVMTGVGTPRSTLSIAVQRPSPESGTTGAMSFRVGSDCSTVAVRSSNQERTTEPCRHSSVTSARSISNSFLACISAKPSASAAIMPYSMPLCTILV